LLDLGVDLRILLLRYGPNNKFTPTIEKQTAKFNVSLFKTWINMVLVVVLLGLLNHSQWLAVVRR
jgi:hypothetical protein